MDSTELRQLLERLRSDLDHATGLDESSRQQMRALVSEIERGVNASPADTERSLSDRLVEAMTSFEAQHPRLTETLSRIADQLGTMGI